MWSSPSMCQRCAINQIWPYANSASTGHWMRTWDAQMTTDRTALPSSLAPMVDESGANPSPSRDKHNLPTSEKVKGHQTRKMAVTYADMAGADPQTICEAATWRNSNTFARFYQLDTRQLRCRIWQESSNAGWLLNPSSTPMGRVSYPRKNISTGRGLELQSWRFPLCSDTSSLPTWRLVWCNYNYENEYSLAWLFESSVCTIASSRLDPEGWILKNVYPPFYCAAP